MPLIIRPSASPDRTLDLTGPLTRAVAEELWRQFGGNDVLNWMEAERIVAGLALNETAFPNPEAPPARHSRAVEPRLPRRNDRLDVRRPRRDDDRVTGPLPVY